MAYNEYVYSSLREGRYNEYNSEEIGRFLVENHNEDGNLFRNDHSIVKLDYLVEMFGKFSVFNKSMQGPQMHSLIQNDKVKPFIKKLEVWKLNLQKNKYDMFPLLYDVCAGVNIEAHKNLFTEHFYGLLMYFLIISKIFILQSWRGYRIHLFEKEKLIELSSDIPLKQKFQSEPLVQFWLYRSEEYNTLSSKALQLLLPFVTSYLCETGFSSLAAMKSIYRARLVVEKELRVALFSMTPRYDKLCANKQAHPSHYKRNTLKVIFVYFFGINIFHIFTI